MSDPAAIPTAAERAAAVAHLEATRDALLAHCSTLDPAAWQRSDGEGRWTVSNILEHLVIVEQRSMGLFEKMLTQPAEPDWHARTAAQDARLPFTVTVTEKIQAPAPLHPQGAATPTQLMADFAAARAATIAFAQIPGQPLKEHTRNHPVLGTLNGYQWLLLAGYHTLRHLGQMQRIPRAAHNPL